MGQLREVDFHHYCNECKYKNDSESDERSPCYDCMEENARIDSRKPINFEKEN